MLLKKRVKILISFNHVKLARAFKNALKLDRRQYQLKLFDFKREQQEIKSYVSMAKYCDAAINNLINNLINKYQ